MDAHPCSSPADVDAVVALQQEWEAHWFGAPENDRDEVLEDLDRREHSLTLWQAGVLVGAAWWWGNHTMALVKPGQEHLHDDLLGWLETTGADSLEALDRDEAQRAVLERRGWTHRHSGFELIRKVTPDWVLPAPEWPDGVRVVDVQDRLAAHQVVYERSRWLEVPGHRYRPYDEWESLMFAPSGVHVHLAAVDGERTVGVALCRTFSDGTGWVAQLAVDRDEQGRGLGRALLLEGLHRMLADGATALGLGVSAENRGALRLYLGVGLRVDREWLHYAPPARQDGLEPECSGAPSR